MRYFVTGVDATIGKTVVSSILVQALSANYWKPIQCGNLDHTDSMIVNDLTTKKVIIYPESYRLAENLPIHLSAKKEEIDISLRNIIFPTSTQLIIESSGGVLDPLNEKGAYLTDMLSFLEAEVIFVIKNDTNNILKAIESIQVLQAKKYIIKGIIIIGDENIEVENLFTNKTNLPILLHLPITADLSQSFIKEQAIRLRPLLLTLNED